MGQQSINSLSTRRLLTFGSFFIVLIFGFPYFFLGEDAFINIHDNLDGEFVNYVMLKNGGQLFNFDSDGILPNLLGGLPLNVFHSEFNFIRVLFLVFSPFWAYVFNMLIVRIIGFIGMYLLLKRYILKNEEHQLQSILIAFVFASIAIYPMYGLSVMGQPLIIWAFLNIRNRVNIRWSFAVLLLYPFYSHFALVAIFLLCALFCLELHLSNYRVFRLNKHAFFSIVFLGAMFIVANLITLKGFVSKSFIGHRTAYVPNPSTVGESVDQFHYTFYNGQYHSGSFNFGLIYIVVIAALLYFWKDLRNRRILLLLILVIAGISLFEGFYPALKYQFRNSFHLLSEFEFCRFTFLLPTIVFVLLGFAIHMINYRRTTLTAITALCMFFSVTENNTEVASNWKLAKGKYWSETEFSYRSFFAEGQFTRIKSDINYHQEKVVCFGFFPSIAQYNGFYTLDGYENNYPLEYKLEFRKVISKELDKNPALKKYFDNWGSRCYLFSDETFSTYIASCTKDKNLVVKKLEIDTQQLKKMKCKYILSSVEVKNASKINLKLTKVYDDNQSIWKIFVYQIV